MYGKKEIKIMEMREIKKRKRRGKKEEARMRYQPLKSTKFTLIGMSPIINLALVGDY